MISLLVSDKSARSSSMKIKFIQDVNYVQKINQLVINTE